MTLKESTRHKRVMDVIASNPTSFWDCSFFSSSQSIWTTAGPSMASSRVMRALRPANISRSAVSSHPAAKQRTIAAVEIVEGV